MKERTAKGKKEREKEREGGREGEGRERGREGHITKFGNDTD